MGFGGEKQWTKLIPVRTSLWDALGVNETIEKNSILKNLPPYPIQIQKQGYW